MSGFVADPQGGFVANPQGGFLGDPVPTVTPVTAGGTTGTYNFNPSLSDVALDAFERCGISIQSLTDQSGKIQSARRSMNYVLSSWANRGVNLWTVQQVTQFMPQGVFQYFDDASCIDILPDSIVIRQFLMGAAAPVTPNFSTTQGSNAVVVAGFTTQPSVGGYISIGVGVSVGGVILDGLYRVQSVPTVSSATILAASPATATVQNSGAVPVFSMTAGSNLVTTTYANHGFVPGQTFNVEAATAIGGGSLLGPYTVLAANLTTNTFQFNASFNAGFNTNVGENGGQTLLASQAITPPQAPNPTDLQIYCISRDEYMELPNKFQQARPTSAWIDRQVVPVLNIWPVPDANGPYELVYRRSRQIQDADLMNGLQLQAPYRFQAAFVSDLAADLAIKFAPDRAQALAARASSLFLEAASEDVERVSTFIAPDFSGLFG